MSSGENIPELFQYERPAIPDDVQLAISPSQISKFFEMPSVWFKENILGEAPAFKGSTASVIGTICHAVYEYNTIGKKITREEINEQLKQYLEVCPNEDVEYDKVIATYPEVTKAVMNQYVIPHNAMYKKEDIVCEGKICVQLDSGIYLAGTYDRLEGTVLCDYKTVGIKPSDTMPFYYRIQLLCYAYALTQLGHHVDRIRLIYGVKPTKTLPARVFLVEEEYNEDAELFVRNALQIIIDTYKYYREHPETAYILFKSMELKEIGNGSC